MTAQTTALKLGAGALIAGLLYAALPQQEQAAALPPAAPSDPFAFVQSMAGTSPDGDVKQSADGQLVVDAELGHLFDYYLAGLGEKDLAAIRAEIERELARRLTPLAASQAKLLLGRYLAYKAALVGVEQQLQPGASLGATARARIAARHKLRLAHFSAAESAGLFGQTDAYDNDALARIEISEDPRLSPDQRAQKLAKLDQQLSPAQREEREAPGRIIKTEETVAALRAKGATDDEIYRLRAAAFSPEGASRLAELDREEAAWKGRIAVYLGERARLAPDQLAALQQLRDAHFSADEQRRLGAYE